MMTRISFVCCVCVLALACGCGSRSGKSAAKKGMAAFKDGQTEKAIAHFTLATERITDSPELYYHLGLAHLKHGNPEPAQKAFEAALELKPGEGATHANTLGGLAQAACAQKAYTNALVLLEQAFAVAPDDDTRVRVLMTMGIVETYCQNYALARLHYLRALKLDFQNAPVRYNLAVLYQDQYGLVAEALDDFGMFMHCVGEKDKTRRELTERRIVRLKANLERMAERNAVRRRNPARAASLLEDGMNAQFARPPQLARAILAFKNALVADPLTFHAAYGLGNVYRQQRMHAEALDAFKNASDINPTNQDSYAQAAEMALQLRQPAEASRILNRAIARSPHNPTSIRLAALAYQAEARIPEAVAYGEFYLSLAPKNEPDRASFERWVRTLKKG